MLIFGVYILSALAISAALWALCCTVDIISYYFLMKEYEETSSSSSFNIFLEYSKKSTKACEKQNIALILFAIFGALLFLWHIFLMPIPFI